MQKAEKTYRIGVLAVQGAFSEHITMLRRCGIEAFEIRQESDIENSPDGLILPGGESTVQTKLLHELNLFARLKTLITQGMPVYGTCAGLLLLAKNIENDRLDNFAAMDITAVRNAYGRQLGSFISYGDFAGKSIPMPFIRAPYIKIADPDIQILSITDKRIVAARQRNMLVTAYHPELTEHDTVHQYFINMLASAVRKSE